MRPIKFRAWDKENNKFVEELLVTKDGEPLIVGEYETIKTGLTNGWKSGDGIVELQQYTGLKDKNGTEIYEGDVLEQLFVEGRANFKKGDKIIVQFFNESDCCFCGFGLSNITPLTFNKCKRMKVIGNIYENENLTN